MPREVHMTLPATRRSRSGSRGGPSRPKRMEEWLFSNQDTLSPDRVRAAARDIGGVEDFDAEYARTLEHVRADIALGEALEVTGTPTFFVNGVPLAGGLAPEYFDAAIAYELERAEHP